jgi:hypothetical protein
MAHRRPAAVSATSPFLRSKQTSRSRRSTSANDPIYGPAVRCKKISSSWRRAVLHQCIRLLFGALAPGHHGYQRACDLIER